MASKVTPYLAAFALIVLIFTAPVLGKVENSDKNDVSTKNETVQVLAIEDLNKTQYLNQNFRQGNYNYGYDVKPEGPNGQFHHENKAPDGIVFGCYGYVDPNDKPQITYYISDEWGYRPVTVGNAIKVFYPSDHSPTLTEEMKGTLRSWAQLQFPKVCANYEQDGATPLRAPAPFPDRFPPPPGLVRTQTGSTLSIKTTSVASQSRGDVVYPGSGGKPGAPGLLSNGGYGGEGGTGGLVRGSAAASGGPGGNGGDGGSVSGSSKASGGNGASGGHAGVASGSSSANGGSGGHGGDGGEASGSSNASGGNGAVGGRGGTASGSSNANGGSAGSGAKGGIASGSSSAIGGGAGAGGDGGNASGSSAARGGVGGNGGRGGTASGSSSANGGTAGAGGRGGNASGSSSASAGDGGSAGNGGAASGSSIANGGSGGLGGSGAGAGISHGGGQLTEGGYSYAPPKGLGRPGQGLHSSAAPPFPATGGLLSEEQYTEDLQEENLKATSYQPPLPTVGSRPGSGGSVGSTRVTQTDTTGYTYPTPSSSSAAPYQSPRPIPTPPHPVSGQGSIQQSTYQGQKVLTTQAGPTQFPGTSSQRPSQQSTEDGTGTTLDFDQESIFQRLPAADSGNYFPGSSGSKPGGLLNPPGKAYQAPHRGQFGTTNNYYPQRVIPTLSDGGPIRVPPGVYIPPPSVSLESEEGDQNGLGNDSGESNRGGDCDRGFGGCDSNRPPPESIDYAQLPGAITSNVPVIFYPDCRSNAYTRPAIVPFCPSLQASPAAASCSHQQPLTMKFPSGGNPYNNVPSSRGAYPSNFGYPKSRYAKRVVRRSRRNQQSSYV